MAARADTPPDPNTPSAGSRHAHPAAKQLSTNPRAIEARTCRQRKREADKARNLLAQHGILTDPAHGSIVFRDSSQVPVPQGVTGIDLKRADVAALQSCLLVLADPNTSTSDRLRACSTYSQLRSRLDPPEPPESPKSLEASDLGPSLADLVGGVRQQRITDNDTDSGFAGFGGPEG